jgi:hypothetical protein
MTLDERIDDHKKEWHNHILKIDSSRLTQRLENYRPDVRRNVDDKIVSEKERANRSLV